MTCNLVSTSAGRMLIDGFRRSEPERPDPKRCAELRERLAQGTLAGLFADALAVESLSGGERLDKVDPEQTMRVALRLMDLAADAATRQAEWRYLLEELGPSAAAELVAVPHSS